MATAAAAVTVTGGINPKVMLPPVGAKSTGNLKKSLKASVTLRSEKIDVTPTQPTHGLLTFLYVESASNDARGDWTYIGCDDGRILSSLVSGRSQRVDDVSTEANKHTTAVTCLMYTRNKLLCPNTDGYLFSGSQDRTIKVWNPTTFMPTKVFVTTCYGHEGSILSLVDGEDGSFLSTAVDGTLKRWTPQRDRNMLLHPFFECTFSISMRDTWFSALAVNPRGCWSCFLGDNNGNVTVYRKDKTTRDKEIYSNTPFTVQLTKHVTWEKFHRLGVCLLRISAFENYLISISFDGTCKISDSQIGCVFFSVANPRHALYTGVVWISEHLNLYLVDELGSVDVFNTFQERIVASTVIKAPKSDSQRDAIIACHKGQIICDIQRFRSEGGRNDQFMLLFPAMNRIHGAVTSTMKQFSGELSTWRFLLDNKCMAFNGHENIVVGISVLDFCSRANSSSDTAASATTAVASADALDGLGTSKAVDDAISVASTGTDGNGEASASLSSKSNATTVTAASSVSKSIGSKIGKLGGVNLSDSTTNTVSGNKLNHVLKDIRVHKPSMLISKEESIFFSVAADASIRCWGEFDGQENYRFKDKSGYDVTCMRVIWSLNCIATGHDNGLLSIWHADSGSRVDSRVLKSSITGLTEARNAHSQLLVGSDLAGHVAIWNLTLYRIRPSELSTDRVFRGYHDKEEPGITSLGFHVSSRTMYSGGEDKTIRSWKIQNDTAHCTNTLHRDVICYLECTESFLLSGDESGEILLWRIFQGNVISPLSAVQTARSSVPQAIIQSVVDVQLSILVRWTGIKTSAASRAVCSLYEVDPKNLFVLQAGRVPDRTYLWYVNAVPKPIRRKTKKVDPLDLYMRALAVTGSLGSEMHALPHAIRGISSKSFALHFVPEDEEDEEIPEVDDGKMLPHHCLYPDAHPDIDIIINCSNILFHENIETTCAQLNLLGVSYQKPKVAIQDESASSTNPMLLPIIAAAHATATTTNTPAPAAADGAAVGTSNQTNSNNNKKNMNPTANGQASNSGDSKDGTTANATAATTIAAADTNSQKSEELPMVRMAQFAVYLGSAEGRIQRFEIETALLK